MKRMNKEESFKMRMDEVFSMKLHAICEVSGIKMSSLIRALVLNEFDKKPEYKEVFYKKMAMKK